VTQRPGPATGRQASERLPGAPQVKVGALPGRSLAPSALAVPDWRHATHDRRPTSWFWNARVADLIAAFGARRAGLRLAAAAISVTAAGRDGGRGQRRCQDQEHSAPRARVPGRSRPVAAPSAGSLAGDNHAGILSLRRVTVKAQGRVVAAPSVASRSMTRVPQPSAC